MRKQPEFLKGAVSFLLGLLLLGGPATGAYATLHPQFTVSPTVASPEAQVNFDASASYEDASGHVIVYYQWDFDVPEALKPNPDPMVIAVQFSLEGIGSITHHHYPAWGEYAPVLRVENDLHQVGYATGRVSVTLGNVNPVALAGGPYFLNVGSNLYLDGTNSYDPNAAWGDYIVSYGWSILGQTLSGSSPVMSYSDLEAAIMSSYGNPIQPNISYPISLQVIDTWGAVATSSTFFSVAAVPIPAAAWLLGSGLIGLAAVRRRFKK